jgi:hypothetical protein
VIDMADHEPEIVGYMIKYLYAGDYTIIQPDIDAAKQPLESRESTPTSIEPLKDFFGSPFGGFGATATPTPTPIPAIDTSPELLKHTAVWLLGDEKDIPGLKDLAARKYANALPHGWNSEEFCKSLERIYEESPDSDPKLRNIAINFAGSKARQLIERGDFADLWEEKGYIGLEVFRAFLSVTGATSAIAVPPQKVLSSTGKCPKFPARHASNIVPSTKMGNKYFCTICRVPFS